MLKGIQKLMKKEQGDVEMSVTELSEKLTGTQKSLEDQVGIFKELSDKYTKLSADYEVIKAALEQSEHAKQLMADQAKEKQLSARKEKIVAAVGTDKADALLTAVDGLADEQFEAIVGAMAMSVDKEAQSPMFTEAGVTGEVDLTKVEDTQSSLEAKLAEKYHSK